jgi:membrane protein insertase Oxa1/YidC/SpoIIIJ
MLFLLAGAAPFLAAATAQVLGRNRVNPFVACWGMLIALPLFYLLWGSL